LERVVEGPEGPDGDGDGGEGDGAENDAMQVDEALQESPFGDNDDDRINDNDDSHEKEIESLDGLDGSGALKSGLKNEGEAVKDEKTEEKTGNNVKDDASLRTTTNNTAVRAMKLATRRGKKGGVGSVAPTFSVVQPGVSSSTSSTLSGQMQVQADCRSWTSVMDSFAVSAAHPTDGGSGGQASGSGGVGNVQAKDVLEENGRLRAYWFDAFEKEGVVYVFAKVCLSTSIYLFIYSFLFRWFLILWGWMGGFTRFFIRV
jgi:hypothetical protein